MQGEVRRAVLLLRDDAERHGCKSCPRNAIVKAKRIGSEGNRLDSVEGAELRKRARRIGAKLDAGASLVGEDRALEKRGAHAVARKRDGRGEATDAAAHDEHASLRP